MYVDDSQYAGAQGLTRMRIHAERYYDLAYLSYICFLCDDVFLDYSSFSINS